jgi:four helix bundle protein
MTSTAECASRPIVRSVQDLVVWQRSIDLAARVFALSGSLAPRYRFSLGDQMNRAVVSIPSNIAEGVGRHHRREYRQHVGVARGSLREVETQLLLGMRIGAFSAEDAAEPLAIADEIGRMLSRLASRLR